MLAAVLASAAAPAVAAGVEPAAGGLGGIGAITSVQGRVSMDHPDPDGPFQPTVKESLQASDVIETHGQSKTKALLHSGSLLTLGEHSRIEIVHHAHDEEQGRRVVTVRLVRGSLRAVVGSAFATEGSKFEVLMPGATVVAQGGVFVLWVEGDENGVANIGAAGTVAFTSGGHTLTLGPGQFTHARADAAPVPAAVIETAAGAGVRAAIDGTHLKESLRHEAPKDAIQEIGPPRAIGLGLGGVGEGTAAAAGGDATSGGVDQAQGGGQSPSNSAQQTQRAIQHHRPAVTHHGITPPSVHSGASNNLLGQRGQGRTRQ